MSKGPFTCREYPDNSATQVLEYMSIFQLIV